MGKISSCLWFNTEGEDAAKFYVSIFKNGKIGNIARYGEASAKATGQTKDRVMAVEFFVEDQTILALNGGPQFKFTPALSYTVWCESEAEIDTLWEKLSAGGETRMALDSYPWSKKYGWTADKYGVDWQLLLAPNKQKITPSFLFVNKVFGRAEEAIALYTSLFPDSKILSMTKDEATKSVAHCHLTLNGQEFVLMDGQGPHNYTFNEAFSLVVNCDSQSEIDKYWEKLAEGGATNQCGWLKDKFGVSWQVVPSITSELMSDPKKSEKVMEAVMKMTKLNIQKMKEAYDKA